MNKMLYDVRRDACKKLIECETEDMEILVDTADTLMQLWYLARKEGIFALDGTDPGDDHMLSEYGKMLQQLIVDGTELDTVIEIGTNEYWKENPGGVASMVWYMYLRGMYGIQTGENHNILQTVFRTLMPLQCHSSWQERIEAKEEREEADSISRFATLSPIFENRELIEKLHELEQEMKEFDDLAVQRILREVGNHDMALCLYGLNGETRENFLSNMNSRLACMIREDTVYLDDLGDMEERDILKSVVSILDIINKLCDSAKIDRRRNSNEMSSV